jgi:hypothetical protein
LPSYLFRQGKQALLGEGIRPVGKRSDAGCLLFKILVVHSALGKQSCGAAEFCKSAGFQSVSMGSSVAVLQES